MGSCLGLFYGGCHGSDEQAVFAELCQIVEETVKLYEAQNRPLPPVTSRYDWATPSPVAHRQTMGTLPSAC